MRLARAVIPCTHAHQSYCRTALRERVLDNSNVARAALFDKEDALQVAGSVKQFDVRRFRY